MKTTEEIEIERLSTSEKIDFETEHVKTALCCRILQKKFKLLVLTFLIIIILLEIFKIVLPTMDPTDQKMIADVMVKSVKQLSIQVIKLFKKTNDTKPLQTTTMSTTTTAIDSTFSDHIENNI